MTGGAAAALTGLNFVALSLQAKAIIGHPLFRDRAFASVSSLMGAIALSAAVLVPGQQPLTLGLEVGLVAAYFTVRVARSVVSFRAANARTRRRPGRRWVIEWPIWLLWLATFDASAVALALGSAFGFQLLAVAILFMFGLSVWEAWVLIEQVAAQPTAR
jgi:modulator of FtsH protease